MTSSYSPVFTDTVSAAGEAFIQALNSGYGSITSAVAPYKVLSNPSLVSTTLHDDFKGITATIQIDAQHQSPHGDNWDSSQTFQVPLSDMKIVSEKAPFEFRHSISSLTLRITDAMIEGLQVEKPRRIAAFKKAVAEMLSSGTGDDLHPPSRAAFRHDKGRSPS